MRTRLILLGLLCSLSLAFLLVQIAGVFSSDLSRQRVPERDFSSLTTQEGERFGSIRWDSEEMSRVSASDLPDTAVNDEGSRSQGRKALRSKRGSAGSGHAEPMNTLPYRLSSDENDYGGIPGSVAGVHPIGAVPSVAPPADITPRGVQDAMVSPARIPTRQSHVGDPPQEKPGMVEQGGVSSGDQLVVNGAMVSIIPSASGALGDDGSEVLELVLSPAPAGRSMAAMHASSTAPAVNTQMRHGSTCDEELFRTKWGWEAYDQALKFAAEAGQ